MGSCACIGKKIEMPIVPILTVLCSTHETWNLHTVYPLSLTSAERRNGRKDVRVLGEGGMGEEEERKE